MLEQVSLTAQADTPVGAFSHGMQKRLSVARALLTNPSVVLVDEATHDLDPHAAAEVRELVAEIARDGAAVLWTTQRLDEIRGFADRVTLLREGTCAVRGLCQRADGARAGAPVRAAPRTRPGGTSVAAGWVTLWMGWRTSGRSRPADREHWLLTLNERTRPRRRARRTRRRGRTVVACHRERSEIEDAFVSLSEDDGL